MAREGLLGRAMDSGATPVGLSSILALGALGPRLGGAQAPLEEWARSADSPRSAHALLALYMAKPEVGQALADELALSHSLAGLLAVHVHPSPLPEHQAVRRWYGLRLGAARRFGLVDGRLWSEILTDRLAKDSTFLEELIDRIHGMVLGFGPNLRGGTGWARLHHSHGGPNGAPRSTGSLLTSRAMEPRICSRPKWGR